ncbi:DUF523 domain-containing protein [Clostridium sp.]|uniref:DUF523 domain-containing protein n=1 Tax=Clostridium sp. TaxID=1506 RepID=UPI003F37F863
MYLISGCLCGLNCKYNGKNNLNSTCIDLLKKGKAVLICPEQLGGLSTPRNPVEIQGGVAKDILSGRGRVCDINGNDVTLSFIKGAKEVLEIAKIVNPKAVILKEGSPSCGVNYVYDGSFTGKKINGQGVTSFLLKENGFDVISDIDLGGNKSGILESFQK